MGYDLAMNHPRKSAFATLAIAACCLAACSAPKPAPELRVTSVSSSEGRSMASQFCSDLKSMSDEKAIERMATRASAAKLSDSDQDAVVDYAGTVVCPEQF